MASKPIKDAGSWLVENLEPLVAIVGGGLALIGERTGDLGTKGLIGAALVVLIAVAIGQLRDRKARKDLGEEIKHGLGSVIETGARLDITSRHLSTDVEALREEVLRLRAGNPYEVVRSITTWDITESGHKASTHRVRHLRFLRDRVVSVTDYTSVARGSVSKPVVKPPFELVGEVEADDGTRHDLIALDRAYNAGSEITLDLARDLNDAFLDPREAVSHNVQDITRLVEMRVIWPLERGVHDIELRHSLGGGAITQLSEQQLTIEPDGRRSYTHREQNPRLGDRITISWGWIELTPKDAE